MYSTNMLPPEISRFASGESIEFFTKAKREAPLGGSIAIIIFGGVFLAVGAGLLIFIVLPVLMGETMNIKVNGVNEVASLSNLAPLTVPIIIGCIFSLVGGVITFFGIRGLFVSGPWVLGTANRMIICHKSSTKSIDWEQFNGVIEHSGPVDNSTLIFQLRTGRMVSRKNAPDRYVADSIYIVGINNASQVEQVCRKRIKENDPTPINNNNLGNPGII